MCEIKHHKYEERITKHFSLPVQSIIITRKYILMIDVVVVF